ncbi:hypothetical protein OQA88_11683 [Cercophora sp. LCS_1]
MEAAYPAGEPEYYRSRRVTDRPPEGKGRLGPFSVVCLVLNRTIGSGIFVTPALVLSGTGTVGASLLLWAFGGLVATCGLLVWLELGLSLPLLPTGDDQQKRPVPRSGGEKNYLEFIYRRPSTDDLDQPKPRYLVRCMYGIAFVTLGNLSGNAIALGIYAMNAAGYSDPKGAHVVGIAIGALTLAVLIHLFSRRGGIIINNCFAVLKVMLLLAIFAIGMVKASGYNLGSAPKTTYNFDTDNSFATPKHDVGSYSNSFLFIVYTYSGFEQPFYVLAEVKRPRKVFPKYTLLAMAIATGLFLLVNIAYFCAVPSDSAEVVERRNMAVVFFGQVFGAEVAKRVMAAVIAVSIFGNILVMTFTASRVKQEIAKEGILPFSLTFATSTTTPLGWWQKRHRQLEKGEYLDQTPMAALGLHWFTSVFLVCVTAGLKPAVAYSVLISLYSYTIIILIGFFTSAGLVYLHARTSLRWQPSFSPPGRWLYAAIYATVCLFMLFASFVPPQAGSPWSYEKTGVLWYLIPTIGLSVPFWGMVWYFGLRLVMAYKGMNLVITRVPVTEPDGDEWVTISEHISQEWHVPTNVGNTVEMK